MKICLKQNLEHIEAEEGHFTSCWATVKEIIEKENIEGGVLENGK